MAVKLLRTLRIALLPALLMLCLLLVPAAQACSLDGIASLSVNGNVASITTDQPTASTLRYWSRFRLLAAAPGDVLHFRENLANVGLSIAKESVSLPFTWHFGDGTTSVGQQVDHRYAKTGWYRVTVQYYWPSRRQWVEFDSAEQHIVPPGDLLRANWGFYAGRVFVTMLRIIIWTALIGLLVLMVLDRFRPGTWRRIWQRRHGSAA